MIPGDTTAQQPHFPSVDRLLRHDATVALIKDHGRTAVTDAIRAVLADLRAENRAAGADEAAIIERVSRRLHAASLPSLRPVFNLTGTVLHTNLGRAVLPREAIDAVVLAAGARAISNTTLPRGGVAIATIISRSCSVG